jgi:hypothetical protein
MPVEQISACLSATQPARAELGGQARISIELATHYQKSIE